jgi:hypothetical protein
MTKIEEHTHHHPQELAIFVIPANPKVPMGVQVIRNRLSALQRVCGGYLTNVPPRFVETPTLRCGCDTLLMVNEEGTMAGRELLANPRATQMFMGEYSLCGDAFLVGRGPIESEGFPELDFISLPQEFNRWPGPGHPVPKPPKVLRLAEKNRKR